MKVDGGIVARRQVDVMHDLAAFGLCNLAVLPFTPTALRSIPKAKDGSGVWSIALFDHRACRGRSGWGVAWIGRRIAAEDAR
jgi:hypothetical protein